MRTTLTVPGAFVRSVNGRQVNSRCRRRRCCSEDLAAAAVVVVEGSVVVWRSAGGGAFPVGSFVVVGGMCVGRRGRISASEMFRPSFQLLRSTVSLVVHQPPPSAASSSLLLSTRLWRGASSPF